MSESKRSSISLDLSSDQGTKKRGCPVISSNTRQPKLQISSVLSTAPVRSNSGALKPSGATGFFGGSVMKYAIQGDNASVHISIIGTRILAGKY